METIETFLQQVIAQAKPGIYFNPPQPEHELIAAAKAIRNDLGLAIPDDYMRLLRITDGIQTQQGYLSPLQDIAEQNSVIWCMESKAGANAEGEFQIQYTPLATPRTPTYIWLGYDGNITEQIIDLATGEYRRRDLGYLTPLNRDRSLVGLMRHMIYRDS